MPERQSRHPDNELLDEMQEDALPTAQQGRSGGEVNRRVGTRAENERADGGDHGVTRAVGSDNPEEDAKKGPKTRAEIQDERDESS